jgi:hypothetical protein
VRGLYGERVRRRLTGEMTIWLTTVGRDGYPAAEPGRVRLGWWRQPSVKFAERFSVPVGIRLTRVRGF